MKFLIPLGGRTLEQEARDSWVLTEYRISDVANNANWRTSAVAGNKWPFVGSQASDQAETDDYDRDTLAARNR